MTRPTIQIGDETRAMTDDEYAQYQEITQHIKQIEGYSPIIIANQDNVELDSDEP